MKADKIPYLYVLIVFLGWGLSIFLDKLVTNRLGIRSITPVVISSLITLMTLAGFYFFSKNLGYDQKGVALMTLSCFLNSVAIIVYYLILVKSEVSLAVPMVALYPVIPIILGFWILKESVSLTKIIGIVLSLAAIILLSV